MASPVANGKLYYTISEVAAMLDVTASLIRYWESEFPHLRPKTNSKGDRRYKTEDIEKLRLVYKLVKVDGYTLQGAKDLIVQKKTTKNQEVIEKMKSLKEFLIGMKQWMDDHIKHSENPIAD